MDGCSSSAALAKQSYRELQSQYPESAYALVLRGEAKYQVKQYPEALRLYSAAAKQNPGLRGVHAALASVYLAINDPAHSETEAQAEQSLGSPDCAREPIVCDFASGRFDDAIQKVKSDAGPEALYWRARASRELADRFCNQLVSPPDSLEVRERRAKELESQSDFRGAAKEWRAALRLAPESSEIRNRLGAALFQSQDFQAVLPELKRLRDVEPKSANMNFFVGESLLEAEQPEQAIPLLLSALKINPHLLPAEVALGLAYVRIGEPAKAIPHLKAGLPIDDKGSLYYQLSRAYTLTKQPKLAQQMMEQYRLRSHPVPNAPVQ